MSLPYFPYYVKDYEAKTAHLTMAEDGAYNRLLRLCWGTPGCSIPADEKWIMRHMRARTDEEKEAVEAVLEEFFDCKNGRYSNATQLRIFDECNEAHQRRKNAGSKGGRAKALKAKETGSSNAEAMPKQPEPEPSIEPNGSITPVSPSTDLLGEPIEKPKKRRSPSKVYLPEGWVPSEKNIAYAIEAGLNKSEIKEIANDFQQYWAEGDGAGQKRSPLGWDQCWANRIRSIAIQYIRNRRVGGAANTSRSGQGLSIASYVAGREHRDQDAVHVPQGAERRVAGKL